MMASIDLRRCLQREVWYSTPIPVLARSRHFGARQTHRISPLSYRGSLAQDRRKTIRCHAGCQAQYAARWERVVNWVQKITNNVEPLDDRFYGPRYRCSITLNDGTFLPCAVLQSKKRLVELAKRRIQEEMNGRGIIRGDDPYGQIVSSFVAGHNRVAAYDVAEATPSQFAPPPQLLSRIKGETTMGWTGWVFRMRDLRLFSYGSPASDGFLAAP